MITLPENIKNSPILTEADLHLLASVTNIPVIDPSFNDIKLTTIFQYYGITPNELDKEVHIYAAELLRQQKVNDAWQVLLSTCVM